MEGYYVERTTLVYDPLSCLSHPLAFVPMRRAMLGAAVYLSLAASLAACADPAPPAGTVHRDPVAAAPDNPPMEVTPDPAPPVTEAPTTTVPEPEPVAEPVPIVPGGPDDPWGPIVCPSADHPAHHYPCRSVQAASTSQRPTTTRTAPVAATPAAGGGQLGSIRACESGGDYAINTGNGYYGAYQYDVPTWRSAATAAGYGEWAGTTANNAPPAVQDAVTASHIANGNRGAWPSC